MSAAGPSGGAGYPARAAAGMIAGALFAAAAAAMVGFALMAPGPRSPAAEWAAAYRRFLAAGGWLWLPLWGASLGLAGVLIRASSVRQRAWSAALAVVLGALPWVLKPVVAEPPTAAAPRTPAAKTRAILRWSYQSPAAVARILPLSRDPDREVREQAVMALGVNLIVTDIERASMIRPSRHGADPLRDSLRARLLEALRDDPDPTVRVEAARGLWKAPLTFGPQPAAAETLRAVLERSAASTVAERPLWLALDAAAGTADRGLRAALERFAAATPDSQLRRAAGAALRAR